MQGAQQIDERRRTQRVRWSEAIERNHRNARLAVSRRADAWDEEMQAELRVTVGSSGQRNTDVSHRTGEMLPAWLWQMSLFQRPVANLTNESPYD